MDQIFGDNSIARIIVRAPNWVGDAVMCTAALCQLRERFPSAFITALARPSIADLLRSHPAIDAVLVYDHKEKHAGLRGKLLLIRQIRKEQFDLAVLYQNALEAAILMWGARVRYRLGYSTDGRGCLLTHPVPLPSNSDSLHHVEYYQQIVKTLDPCSTSHSPLLTIAAGLESETKQRLATLGIQEGDVVIGANPGSMYGGAKRWMPERFAETLDRLIDEGPGKSDRGGGIHAVIVGAPGEEELGRSIASMMKNTPVVWSGQTSLPSLMAFIHRCQLFITNDTGPMHIANAFGVPVVAIFGPTDHRTTSPFKDPYSIVRTPVDCSPCLLRECPIDHRCMTQVTVDAVVRTAEDMLKSNTFPRAKSLG